MKIFSETYRYIYKFMMDHQILKIYCATFLSWFNVLVIVSINLLNLSNSWNKTIAVGVTVTPKFLLTLLISYNTDILAKISFAMLSMNSSLLTPVMLIAKNLIHDRSWFIEKCNELFNMRLTLFIQASYEQSSIIKIKINISAKR